MARRNLRSFSDVRLTKIDGAHLPFDDCSIDLSFTVTVLHHVTDAAMLEALVKDICRVTRDIVVIMEDIGQCEQLGGGGSFTGRTVGAYENLLAKYGFQLHQTQFLNTKVSRRWYEFAWRVYRRFFAHDHHEGDRINSLGKVLIGLPLIVTRGLDNFLTEDQNLAKLTFVRKS
jgi:ubiquinone/menaquinone biosynthesis C-methylase UbiE